MFFKYLFAAFVVLCPAVIVASKNRPSFDVYNMTCRSRSNQLKRFECSSIKTAPGQFVLNFRFMAGRNLGKEIELHLKLHLKPLRGKKTVTYIDLKVGLCEALTQPFSNVLLKGFVDEIRRTGNLPYGCPYKANFLYKVENYTLMNQAIPSFTPSVNCTFTMDVLQKDQLLAEYILESSFLRGDDDMRKNQ